MGESMRRRLERAEDETLAPYALRSSGASRRHRPENEGRAFDYRTEFQRDRDRILYSRAFRRLRQKAMTGILPDYEDHRRNRLTHTLEVAQLGRTIARALRLNEDLVEAVALGHDLGQPPFGPAGEGALDDLLAGRLDGRGGPGLGDLGGFDRAAQALRVVDLLEKRYAHPGLNLSDPVREGILECGRGLAPQGTEGVRAGLPPSFEAQVVALADRIASALEDLDDALQSGAVDAAPAERLRAVAELRRKLGSSYPQRGSRFVRANAIHRGLTHLFVTGAILSCGASLSRWASKHRVKDPASFLTARDHPTAGEGIVLSRSHERMLGDLEGFLASRVHRGSRVERAAGRGRRVILGLFAAFQADPALLDDHVLLRYKETAGVRYLRDVPQEAVEAEVEKRYRGDRRFVTLLADHLAGMTDMYALGEHARLLEMGAIPIPSSEQLRRERDR